MNFFGYLRVELRRMLHSPFAGIIFLLSVIAPAAGYNIFHLASRIIKSSAYIANPALAGATFGAVLFAILTLFEQDRVHRHKTAVITDCIVSPVTLDTVRVVSLLLTAIFSGILTSVLYLPYTVIKLGVVFRLSLYLECIWLITVPAYIISIMTVAAFYQIIRRIDISFLLFLIFSISSISGMIGRSFLLRWMNPVMPILSDDFGNSYILRMTAYNRLFWLIIITGFWLVSVLCIRRHGQGLAGSFADGCRKIALPFLAILCFIAGWYLYHEQPFVDHSPLEIDYEELYHEPLNDKLSYQESYIDLIPNTKLGTVRGTATIQVSNPGKQEQEGFFRINPGYKIDSITANGAPVPYEDLNDDNNNMKNVKFLLPKEAKIELVIHYGGFPQMWSIIEQLPGGLEISDDYIFLLKGDFGPMMDIVRGLPGNYTADITLPSNLIPVTKGTKAEMLRENEDGTITWHSVNDTDIWHLYAAEYDVKRIEAAGAQIDFYYSAQHKEVMDRIHADQTLKDVFEYCSRHYGPNPHLKGQIPFKLVELTAFEMGGFAGNGISVMGETSFSEDGLKDPMKGASGSEVMAHEIIHQWWGLGRGFTYDAEEAEEGWSAEGITVYSTYRLMKEKYGAEYAKKYYVDLWMQRTENYYNNFYYRNPQYLELLPEAYQAGIKNQNPQVLQYCVMPLKILKAEQLVGGEEKMDEILADIFQNGAEQGQGFFTYKEFLSACGLTKEDLNLE